MPEELMKLLVSKMDIKAFYNKLWDCPAKYEEMLVEYKNVFPYADYDSLTMRTWDVPRIITVLRIQYQNPKLRNTKIFNKIYNDISYRSFRKLEKAIKRFDVVDEFAMKYANTLTKYDEIARLGKQYPEFYQDWIQRITNGTYRIETKFIDQFKYVAKNILPAEKISDWFDDMWLTQALYPFEAMDLLVKWYKKAKEKGTEKEVNPYTQSLKTSYDLERRF